MNLEKYESVERWLRDVAFERSGSLNTRRQYLEVLRLFCGFMDKNPEEMISECEMTEETRQDYVDRVKDFAMEGGKAKGTVVNYTFVLKSFFEHNGVHLAIRRIQNWVTYEDRVITPEELHKLLQASDLRTRCEIAILAQSGMRIGTLAKLTYGHVMSGLERGETPIRIHISSGEAKGRVRSFDTFTGPEAIDYLKLYLEARHMGTKKIPGERLTEKSPLFRDQRKKKVEALGYPSIYRDIRKALLKTRLVERKGKPSKLRPHSLRKFFKTQLEIAGVSRTFIEFMMGHTLPGTESAYFKPTVDQLREAYMKGLPFLSLKPRREVKEEFRSILEVVKAKRGDPEVSRLAEKLIEALSEEKVYSEAPSSFVYHNSINFCPRCRSPVDSDALVCDQCGEKHRIECAKCQTLNKIGAKYCKKCGEKISQN